MSQPSRQRRQDVSKQDWIIAVMGPTGSGKSTFIERATRQDGGSVGHGLRSRTADVRTIRTTHPAYGHPVVFVDTPGFDDTSKSDVEILGIIADFLVETYQRRLNLAAIIYMHKISDNRITGSMAKNLRIFTSLCGQKAMPNVIIASTMWSKVDPEEGLQREEELKDELWKDILAQGCRCERFENTFESAWHIVSNLVEKDRAPVLLPRQIVDSHLRLNETKAGIALNKELEKLIKDGERKARNIRHLAKNQHKDLVVQGLNELIAEIDDKIRYIAGQLRQMKIPFTRRIYLFFKITPS